MEYGHPTSQGSERIDQEQPGYYLHAIPSEALAGVGQRFADGLDRADREES